MVKGFHHSKLLGVTSTNWQPPILVNDLRKIMLFIYCTILVIFELFVVDKI